MNCRSEKIFFSIALFYSLICCFVLFGQSMPGSEQDPELDSIPKNRVNIITYKNGKGLENDYNILEKELTKLGYQVNYVNIFVLEPPPKAYINIFLETGSEYFFRFAKKNYVIPTPDWFINGVDLIRKFDLILCKTQEAQKTFSQWNPNTKFTSFTCADCYNPKAIKNYKLVFHFAGLSTQKGTRPIELIWQNNSILPPLYIVKNKAGENIDRHNIFQINGYILPETLNLMQNMCGLHLCPSETEGFAQTILEAMSTEAVVVTTDAPPMTELIIDPRCLAGANGGGSQYLATLYYVDQVKLERTINYLLRLPEEELIRIGKRNRIIFLENDAFFKKSLAEIFNLNEG